MLNDSTIGGEVTRVKWLGGEMTSYHREAWRGHAKQGAEGALPHKVYNLVTREVRVLRVVLVTCKVGRPNYRIYRDGVF